MIPAKNMATEGLNGNLTPMLRQYLGIKRENPDSILLFRLGDFYEMFFDDAVVASKILDITLTSRNRNDPNPVPLCGIPYHSIEPYIARLLECGKKIAICDQVEDPRFAKGIVRREVTRVITPGVVADGIGLSAVSHNFLASAVSEGDVIGFAIADVSTGLFRATEFPSIDFLAEEIVRAEPREILLPRRLASDESFTNRIRCGKSMLFTTLEEAAFKGDGVMSIEGGGPLVSKSPVAARAAAAILSYLASTLKGNVRQITSIGSYMSQNLMRLDASTIRNLELVRSMATGDRCGSVLESMDRSSTAQGARKLVRWLLYPLTSTEEISDRLGAVDAIISDPTLLRDLPHVLSDIYDLERIAGRIAASAANARDMIALKGSLDAAGKLKGIISGVPGLLSMLADSIDPCADYSARIASTIVDDPPFILRDGGFIRSGVSRDLDELRGIIADGKDFIARLESSERVSSGIGSLKVRFNKVFGYYIEVTNAHLAKVPDRYMRKQTLANAERFITPELKEYEEKVLGAEEKVRALEYELFQNLREEVAKGISRLQRTADAISTVDVLTSFARVAAEFDYCRPTVDTSDVIDIRGGRHPIVERRNPTERFVPNDVYLDGGDSRLMMITGPNMAGKSTAMRQTALIVLMAQMGSFVPATSGHIGVVDRIFTRVGASDALARGQSTFMVEMTEAAAILRDATPRSLVIIDEIGRGTSTFDGLAIAWSVAEDLHDRVMARTMFATHYHELTDLALTKPCIKNMQIAVKEWNGEVVFLRRLIPGGTSRSYGIAVAKLAGLPKQVIDRAAEVLDNMEKGELDEVGQPRLAWHRGRSGEDRAHAQYQLFSPEPVPSEIVERLRQLDTSATTPIEALNLIHEWKNKV